MSFVVVRDGQAGAFSHDPDGDAESGEQHEGGSGPQPGVVPVHARAEQDEFAIAGHEVIANLLIALAREQHVVNLEAQIGRQRDVGIGQGLVLALHAAQLVGQVQIALLHDRIGERWRVVHGEQRRAPQGSTESRQSRQLLSPLHVPALALAGVPAARCGRKRLFQSSIVMAPISFSTTMPCGLTRKLSGAPYTPQSMATRPS